jgi:hypothetical protein
LAALVFTKLQCWITVPGSLAGAVVDVGFALSGALVDLGFMVSPG